MTPDWIDAESSALVSFAYDENAETIYVRFHSGAEWAYAACSPAEWEDFKSPSTSKGKFLNEVLKSKPATRIA